jgi:hypothetical protein
MIPKDGMSEEALAEYYAGYEYNEMDGAKKEW